MKARKRFGQHFLHDEHVLQRMVSAISPADDDALLEIGPGRGALTEHLVDRVRRYAAVELDRDLVPVIAGRYPRIELTQGDILKVDLPTVCLDDKAWRVVGNLPYNISSPLIMRCADVCQRNPGLVRDMHFMLQKEMAQRLAAVPDTKQWGRLSVMAQIHFDVEILFEVGPESFTPPPKVDSSVLRLQPRPHDLDLDLLVGVDRVLRMAFAGRRKTLSNSLKSLDIDWASAGVESNLRADNVSLDGFVNIARQVGS